MKANGKVASRIIPLVWLLSPFSGFAQAEAPEISSKFSAYFEQNWRDAKFAAIMTDGEISRVLKGSKTRREKLDAERHRGDWLLIIKIDNWHKYESHCLRISDDAVQIPTENQWAKPMFEKVPLDRVISYFRRISETKNQKRPPDP